MPVTQHQIKSNLAYCLRIWFYRHPFLQIRIPIYGINWNIQYSARPGCLYIPVFSDSKVFSRVWVFEYSWVVQCIPDVFAVCIAKSSNWIPSSLIDLFDSDFQLAIISSCINWSESSRYAAAKIIYDATYLLVCNKRIDFTCKKNSYRITYSFFCSCTNQFCSLF